MRTERKKIISYIYFSRTESIKVKLFKLIRLYKEGSIKEEELRARLASYFGWLKYCNSKKLLQKIYQETNVGCSGWNGVKTNITRFKGKWIYVVNVQLRNKYFLVQFIYNNKPYEFKSSNKQLFMYLQSLLKYPVSIKIEKCLQQQERNLQLNQESLNH